MMPKLRVQPGDLFGRLCITEELPPQQYKHKKIRYFRCECVCGNYTNVRLANLRSGCVTSCGCYGDEQKRKSLTTHGGSSIYNRHRLYNIWATMKRRCMSESCSDFIYYGGRGITICKEWMDFKTFVDDMYPSYVEGYSIDRIDYDKGYFLSNCRWASSTIQNRNRRTTLQHPSGIPFYEYLTQKGIVYRNNMTDEELKEYQRAYGREYGKIYRERKSETSIPHLTQRVKKKPKNKNIKYVIIQDGK